MKFKRSLICIALLPCASLAHADDYSLSNANTSKVKFSDYACKACKINHEVQGQVTVGFGAVKSSDDKIANDFNAKDGVLGSVSADVKKINASGITVAAKADNLGMQSSRAQVSVGRPGSFNVAVKYRLINTYRANLISPYSGIGSDNLLYTGTYNNFNRRIKREGLGVSINYYFNEMVSAYFNYEKDTQTGIKTTSGYTTLGAVNLPLNVDNSTDIVNTGLQLKGTDKFLTVNYNGVFFRNHADDLQFNGSPLGKSGIVTQDPDSDTHIVSISGQSILDANSILSARAYFGKTTQNEQYTTVAYNGILPADSENGKVYSSGVNLKFAHKFSPKIRLDAGFDLDKRDDKSDSKEYISIDNVRGLGMYNTPYDLQTTKFRVSGTYKLNRGSKIETGVDYKQKDLNYSDIETTKDKGVWAKYSLNTFDMWNMWAKLGYSKRDGSAFNAKYSSDNLLLRRFNVADRERTEISAHVTHTPLSYISVDFGARYANDDYNETQIGLKSSDDLGLDASVTYSLTKNSEIHVFYNYEQIVSKQDGSTGLITADWTGKETDEINLVGIGGSTNNIVDNKLSIGLDYTYSRSTSDNKVVGYNSSNDKYYSKVSNVNVYAKYQVNKNVGIRLDYMYERYQDNDLANSLAPEAIPNLVTLGPDSHNYNANFVMLSVNYKL